MADALRAAAEWRGFGVQDRADIRSDAAPQAAPPLPRTVRLALPPPSEQKHTHAHTQTHEQSMNSPGEHSPLLCSSLVANLGAELWDGSGGRYREDRRVLCFWSLAYFGALAALIVMHLTKRSLFGLRLVSMDLRMRTPPPRHTHKRDGTRPKMHLAALIVMHLTKRALSLWTDERNADE